MLLFRRWNCKPKFSIINSWQRSNLRVILETLMLLCIITLIARNSPRHFERSGRDMETRPYGGQLTWSLNCTLLIQWQAFVSFSLGFCVLTDFDKLTKEVFVLVRTLRTILKLLDKSKNGRAKHLRPLKSYVFWKALEFLLSEINFGI